MDASYDHEREAFWRELIEHYTIRLRGYIRRAHLDDSTDDILWDVWQLASQHETELVASEGCWPILQGVLKEVLRERKHIARYERTLDRATLSATSSSESVEEAVYSDELIEWALAALGQLTEKQRLAVDYRFRWNWPYRIVAAAIDATEATTRVHVMRGLTRLRKMAVHLGRADKWTLTPTEHDERAVNKTTRKAPQVRKTDSKTAP